MSELQTGTLLNVRYRVEGRLGAGGMGEVYLGRDIVEDRQVAIKCMRGDLERSANEMFLRRFRDEVEVVRRLNFPGVPSFVDAFECDGHSILVMEFIEGHSLEQLLKRAKEDGKRGLPPQLVVQMGIEVCTILDYLHSQDPPMIHRDIKPGNIIIRTRDERVFLVDFGLAREVRSQSSFKTIVGTAEYAPVEQFQGKPEARSDLYALGVTMHELLTAVPPTPLALEPIKNHLPNLHEDLVRIINRATRKLVEERYPSANDMEMLLQDALPRLNEVEAVVTPPAEPGDKVEELIRRWGRGKTESVPAKVAPAPSPLPAAGKPVALDDPVPLDDPILRRNVQRAGERVQRLQTRRPGVHIVLVMLLVIAAVVVTGWWHEKQAKLQGQKSIVLDAVTLGEGWRLLEAAGIFPSEGVGLSNSELGSKRGGFIFQGNPPNPVRTISLRLRKVRGEPRILVLAAPWGILLEPQKDRYEARLVNIEGAPSSLSSVSAQAKASFPKLSFKFEQMHLTLSFSGSKGILQVDNKAIPFTVDSNAPGHACGVVLLESPKNSRCVVSEWKLL